jgi:hypothetical protein
MSWNATLSRRQAALRSTLRAGARSLARRGPSRTPASNGSLAAGPGSLGCNVVRHVTDAAGRTWTVREVAASGGLAFTTLVFQSDHADGGTEIRRSGRVLTALDNAELLRLLAAAG